MLRVTGVRLLMLAVVLGLAIASVAGVTFSSNSAGGKGVVTAIRYSDVVRFTVQNEQGGHPAGRGLRSSREGKRLFDSGPVMGNALDWTMTTEAGERVAHGVYLYVITAWDSQGELVKSQVERLASSKGLSPASLAIRQRWKMILNFGKMI